LLPDVAEGRARDELDEADALLSWSWKIRKAELPAYHPELAASYEALAGLEKLRGNGTYAERHARSALYIHEQNDNARALSRVRDFIADLASEPIVEASR